MELNWIEKIGPSQASPGLAWLDTRLLVQEMEVGLTYDALQ